MVEPTTSNITAASPSGDLQAEIINTLGNVVRGLGFSTEGLELTLRAIPLEGAWGFGSPVAFQLRKSGATGNPQEIATRIAAAVPHIPQLERVEAVNGYVNFYVDKNWYANRVVSQVLTQGSEYGRWPSRGERVMVEYANLNTHKTMHVGHLRNVVLGNAVYNIVKCAGYDAVGATYIGDIGLHVIRTLWSYLRFHRGGEPAENRGAWLEHLYVEATARLEYRTDVVDLIEDAARADPAIAAQVTNVLQALVDTSPDDEPHARQIAESLTSREGPDWETVMREDDHIILQLWDALGRALVPQPSALETTNRGAAPTEPEPAVVGGFLVTDPQNVTADPGSPQENPLAEAPGPQADTLAPFRRDYERLDAHREWWDQVPAWQSEIKDLFARWEAEDPEVVELWTETREWSLDLLRRIFADLGISFHAWFFESEVEIPGKAVVEELIDKGIALDLRPDGGPVLVRIDEQLRTRPELARKYDKELFKKDKDGTLVPKEAWRVLIVLRSDGTSLYATKDLELARRKFDQWHIDRSIYVIDTRQSLYFQQVFKVLELWSFPQAEKSVHLAYEFVNTPEGAISSRKGGAPLYEDFEREALSRARAIVDQKEADQPRGITEQQKAAISQAVAYGAMKMGMLDKDNNKVITFTWDQALNPESQSATYVQYSHARATRVLEKAPADALPSPTKTYDFTGVSVEEAALLELVAKLPEEVARAADAYKPVIIATYCFELADAFNTFYHNSPILKAPTPELVRARLALTASVKQALANALGLLGIQAPEMM